MLSAGLLSWRIDGEVRWYLLIVVSAGTSDVTSRRPSDRRLRAVQLVRGVGRVLATVGRFLLAALAWAGQRVRGVVADGSRALVQDPTRGKVAMLLGGAALSFLLLIALGIFVVAQLTTYESAITAVDVVVPVVVVVVVGTVGAGPPLVRMLGGLGEERAARLRAEERAEVAVHLHDSVLQTLMLIQRRSGEPEVASLARTQERELRNWLYGRRPTLEGDSFRQRLGEAMAEVEDRFGVRVTVVVVGDDIAMDDSLASLIGAAREAATNAAVHAGVANVDVFAEVASSGVDVFVLDAGRGFDPAAVAGDRRGLTDSIVGRVERAGGWAEVESWPGDGTEISLHLARGAG